MTTRDQYLIAGGVSFFFCAGGLAYARKWVQGYWFDRRARMPSNLVGARILVTGANSGTGLAYTKICANLGAKVYMLCRSEERCKRAMQDIRCRQEGGVKYIHWDASDISTSWRAAQEIVSEGGNLDVVMLNAGIGGQATAPAGSSIFEVNYLGHFALTHALLEMKALRSSNMEAGLTPTERLIKPPCRVISVSSGAHHMGGGRIDFDNPTNPSEEINRSGYGQSKLAQIMHMKELQERYPHQMLTASITPGFVRTEIVAKQAGSASKLLYPLFLLLGRSPKMGVQVMCHCSFGDDITPGGYYSNCLEKLPQSEDAMSRDARKRLWDLSMEMMNKAKTAKAKTAKM